MRKSYYRGDISVHLPFEIRNQIIQCIGSCFHYKDNVEAFFISCGVNKNLASKDKSLAKFVWARSLLADLDDIEDGFEIQKRILTELCKLRNLPDKDAPNPDAGLSALRKLKELAVANKLEIEDEKTHGNYRKQMNEEKTKIIQDRAKVLNELKNDFASSIISVDRQKAGYSLEDILEKLFSIFNLDYRKSYKTVTQQIDGSFKFEGFNYLVEAKWRTDQPSEGEIGEFKRKVDTKLDSTRGIFVSISGFRDEVVKCFDGQGSNILFFSGEDITHILEGRMDLDEIIRIKIDKAAQEGKVYFPVLLMLKRS